MGDGTARCTSSLISHRFSTVRMADRIIVLETARSPRWAHAELLAKGGMYAKLFTLQAEGYKWRRLFQVKRGYRYVGRLWKAALLSIGFGCRIFLSHLDDNLAFGTSCFDVSQSLFGRFEWKDPIHYGAYDPRIDERTDLA